MSGTLLPTDEQARQMGFVRCHGDGCLVWVEPANVPDRLCARHQPRRSNRDSRESRPESREQRRDWADLARHDRRIT